MNNRTGTSKGPIKNNLNVDHSPIVFENENYRVIDSYGTLLVLTPVEGTTCWTAVTDKAEIRAARRLVG